MESEAIQSYAGFVCGVCTDLIDISSAISINFYHRTVVIIVSTLIDGDRSIAGSIHA